MEEIVEGCLMIMMIMVMMMMSRRRRRRRRMSMVCGALSRFLRRRLSLSVVSLSQTMMLVSSWWSSLSSSSSPSSSSSSSLLSSPSSLWLWKKEIMRLHQNCMEQIQSILIWVTLCRSSLWRDSNSLKQMSLLAWDFLSLGEMPYADAGQGRLMLRSNERNTNTKIENFKLLLLLLLLQLWDCCWSASSPRSRAWRWLKRSWRWLRDNDWQPLAGSPRRFTAPPRQTRNNAAAAADCTAHCTHWEVHTVHTAHLHTAHSTSAHLHSADSANHPKPSPVHCRACQSMEGGTFLISRANGKMPFNANTQCPVDTSTPDLGCTMNCSLISFHAAECIQVNALEFGVWSVLNAVTRCGEEEGNT